MKRFLEAATNAVFGPPTNIPRMAKRGYSRDFKVHGNTGKRYLLDEIPAGLWADVKAKCKRDGISIRALILQLLTTWLDRRDT